jgi:hypothetical protein
MTNLRTALQWLDEQDIGGQAECWVLGNNTVQPIVHVTWTEVGDVLLWTLPPWTEPSPTPLQFARVSDMLLEHYSGGGSLRWANQLSDTYRGSYVVNSESAVFFLFLPPNVRIMDSHDEKMEQRKQQAIELTKRIEESQTWPTSM